MYNIEIRSNQCSADDEQMTDCDNKQKATNQELSI